MKVAVAILRQLGRIALRLVVVVWLVAAISWLMAEAAPGTAAERAARAAGVLPADDSAVPDDLRDRILARVADEYGLGDSLGDRLAGHLGGMFRGDLGRSWRDGSAVRSAVVRACVPTLSLILCALLVAIIIGVGAALAAARRPAGPLDIALSAAAAAAFAVPPVWLAMLALRTFADGHPWRVVPAEGLDSAAAWVLPVFCLALVPAFAIARHARAALVGAAREPWAVAARARGASRDRVLMVHALRAVLGELAAVVAVLVGYLIGASMVMEELFGIPGLGALLLSASGRGDAPVIVGVAVCAGVIMAAASIATDLFRRAADPRQRRGGLE